MFVRVCLKVILWFKFDVLYGAVWCVLLLFDDCVWFVFACLRVCLWLIV